MMKKTLILLLAMCLLLGGCQAKEVVDDIMQNLPSSKKEQTSEKQGGLNLDATNTKMNQKTNDALIDNAPMVTHDNHDEFIAYLKENDAYVELEDFVDKRNPYETKLAKESKAKGKGVYEFYQEQDDLKNKLTDFVDNNVDAYNDNAGFDDMILMMYMPMYSMDLAMGATLSEQTPWATVSSGIVQAYNMLGGKNAKAVRNDAHDYTITFENEDGKKATDHYIASSDKGFQMTRTIDKKLNSFYEYVQVGNKHIWQSETERMYVEYDGDKIKKYAYTKIDTEKEKAYTKKDLIFENPDKCSLKWTYERKNNKTKIVYDGKKMSVLTEAFLFGGMCEATIKNVKQ